MYFMNVVDFLIEGIIKGKRVHMYEDKVIYPNFIMPG